MRLRQIALLFPLVAGLAAADVLPSLEEIPDPYGLGPRLALIDYLREELGVEPESGADLVALERQYESLRAQRSVAAEPVHELRSELTRRLWVDYGMTAPDGATVAQLEELIAVQEAAVDAELARQQALSAVGDPSPAPAPVERRRPATGGGEHFVLVEGRGVGRSALTALSARPGSRDLEPREIAARCAGTVALIFTENGSGTGFFVNRSGLMLTCAHVLPDPGGKLGVKFTGDAGAGPAELVAGASLVAVDLEADLALLQVDTTAVTGHVVFERAQPIEMGEEVSVIGNPGLGAAVLEQTMTQGIISSPARDINGIQHVQTSAAINPGNSGGPMFNQRGNLIALVVSKGREVEGVGFAVARDEVAAFLERCVR